MKGDNKINGVIFDFEALLRSVIIALGTGLIVVAITHWVLKLPRGVTILFGVGVTLILTVILVSRLIEVPRLANLSRAEAELVLSKKKLIPEVRPQYVSTTEAGRVIPHSQDPLPGIKVRQGTVVRFAVSAGAEQLLTEAKETGVSPYVSLFQPRSGEEVHCSRYGDGIYRFSVEGVSKGIAGGNLQLLLWVKPVDPPSETPGWYLQRLPINGIVGIKPDGAWEGIGQMGDAQWPPHQGDILDVAVTVVKPETAQGLLAEMGVVTRMALPGTTSDKALGVKVRLK